MPQFIIKFIFIISYLSLMHTLPVQASNRVALLMGNQTYKNDSSLKNPVRDVRLIKKALQSVGFKVIERNNVSRSGMKEALRALQNSIQPGDVGLVYYSGHGLQYDSDNYLIPVDASIVTANEIPYEAMSSKQLLSYMDQAVTRIVILDACRDNPYQTGTKGIGKGLGHQDLASSQNTLIAFAAAPNQQAQDGNGINSPYAVALAAAITQQGLSIESVFKQVRKQVVKTTANKQTPWYSASMENEFYFNDNLSLAANNSDVQFELSFWNSIANSQQAADYLGYIQAFPQGRFVGLANTRIKALLSVHTLDNNKNYPITIKTTPADARVRILNIAPRYQNGMLLKPGQYKIEVSKAGYNRHTDIFELTADNTVYYVELDAKMLNNTPAVANPSKSRIEPTMVNISGFCYQMGSPDWENGRDDDEPRHQVCVDNFQMGKKEVTVGEFRRFVRATGYRTQAEQNVENQGCYAYSSSDKKWAYQAGNYWDNVGFSQNEQHPVVCVSWFDVQNYISWLNEKSSGDYRLPTEAEWEFAARGGTQTAYFWGSEVDSKACAYGNVNDQNWSNDFYCNDAYEYTAPTGNYKMNKLGLYDMSGNVLEWTCSRYDKKYTGGEKKCFSKNNANNSGYLVLRGGSFDSKPRRLRVANRSRSEPLGRFAFRGFRLARTR